MALGRKYCSQIRRMLVIWCGAHVGGAVVRDEPEERSLDESPPTELVSTRGIGLYGIEKMN